MWGLGVSVAAHATPQVASLAAVPSMVPAGGTVVNTVRVADTDSQPIGAPGFAFTFAIPANTLYRGTGVLPSGVSCASTVAIGGAGPGTVTCSGITLAANQILPLDISLQTQQQGFVPVTASIVGHASSETKSITVAQGADVALVMTAPTSAASGSTQPITFTLTNNGPDASTGSTLSYPIPTGLSVASSGLPSGCSISANTLICNASALPVGGIKVFTVNGIVSAASGSTITHQAAVAPAGSVGDGVSTNNDATRSTTVTPGTLLALTKTHNGGQLLVGQAFNFTLAPSFSGNPPVGVTITDTLPANFSITGPITAAAGWTCAVGGQTVSCTRTNIGGAGGANTALGTITIPVTAISAGTGVVNEATVSATGPVAGSVVGSVPANVAQSSTDFRADKTSTWPQNNVPLNQAFDYRLGSTNLGGTRLLKGSVITLVDNLPVGMKLNSVTSQNGYSCVVTKGGATVAAPVDGPATVTCQRTLAADLAVNASGGNVLLNTTITTLPAAGAQVVNNMCVNAALPAGGVTNGANPDANQGNNCVDAGVGVDGSPTTADVEVQKRVVGIGDSANNRQQAGLPVVWEIEVVNRGPSVARNVAVSDSFKQMIGPVGSITQNANGGVFGGTCSVSVSNNTGTLTGCNLATLPVCRPANEATSGLPLCPVIRVSARHFGDGASASDNNFAIGNKVSALAATPADPKLDDAGLTNSATATAYFTAITDVTVTKNASPAAVKVGQLLTYTLTAKNTGVTSGGEGFSRAYDVTVTDTLPPNLKFISATSSTGSCTTQPNTTQVTGPGNNQLVCTLGNLDRDQQQTVTVKVRPLAVLNGTNFTNNASVATVTPEDRSNNNAANAAASVLPPDYDLAVEKKDDADPVNVGDNVTYTITLKNNKSSTAEGVRLTETLPSVGTVPGEPAPTLVSVTPPLGVTFVYQGGAAIGAAGGQIIFTVPVLGGNGANSAGEPSTLAFKVVLKGAGKGQFVNNVAVDFFDSNQNQYDTVQGNNAQSESTNFRYKADVQVLKKQAVVSGGTTPQTTVATGQSFDWLVDVVNNGPQSAEDTTFRDTLPAGLVVAAVPTFTVTSGGFTPAQPLCVAPLGGASVSCAITSMPNLGTATVRIPVRFADGAAPELTARVITNRASIVTTGSGDTNGGSDPNAGNNYGEGSITVHDSTVAGRVYEDLNGNGQPDSGEPAIAGVTITLAGTDSLGRPVTLSTTTDATGAWRFVVPAGTYTVTETQPSAYQAGITRAGTVAGVVHGAVSAATGQAMVSGPLGSDGNAVTGITLAVGEGSINNNFGEVRFASLAGRVYHDKDYSGAFSAGDPGIEGVSVQLTTTSGLDMFGNAFAQPPANTAATTGNYSFPNLWPGNYVVTEPQPVGFADGPDAAGSAGGSTATNDSITGVVLASNVNATGYNFGELLTRIPVQVFVDPNNDGLPNDGAANVGLSGVVVTLTGKDAKGNPVTITATATGTPGQYEFLNVPPSDGAGYTITETQPAGYAPGKANNNGQPGTPAADGNSITGVTVAANPPVSQGTYYFGELTGNNVSGRVYYDKNGNGTQGGAEPGMAGVTVTLTGKDINGITVNRTATTSAAGDYVFADVGPSDANGYTLTESRPVAYEPGLTKAGVVTGTGSVVGTVPTSGTGVTNGPLGSNANTITGIKLVYGGGSTQNNFSHVKPATLAGLVYADVNPINGVHDAAEPGIKDVTVTLTGTDLFGNVVKHVLTTDVDGKFKSPDLLPGTYALAETQPLGYADGMDALGTGGGILANDQVTGIVLVSEVNATGYHFGEVLTRITVQVFVDPSNDGLPNDGVANVGIPGVVLTLTGKDAKGNPVTITATATGTPGQYEFLNVPPSDGAGYTITETQPAGYAPGKANNNGQPGTPAADGNSITGVTVAANPPVSQGAYYFGEIKGDAVRGRVYYDRNGNGVQDAVVSEPGFPGITVTLTGKDVNGNVVNRTATTDAQGDYAFLDVGPSDANGYTLTEGRPVAGYESGLTKAGAVTGAGSVAGTVPTTGAGVTAGPNGSNANTITGIKLVYGGGSTQNNFSHVKPATLAGLVYADVNPSNGVHDAAEPGIKDVTVTLTGTDLFGNAVKHVLTTDVDGKFKSPDLLPGTYQLDETQPTGMADGPETMGTVAGVPRGTANPGGVNDRFGAITLASEDEGINYLFAERGGELAGYVYVDTNNDGIRQATERPIAGVTLTLSGKTSFGLTVNATALTDALGRYVFTGLLPADAAGYTLKETQPVTYADGLDAVGTVDGMTNGTLGNDVLSAIRYVNGNGDNYNFGELGASLAGKVFNDVNGNGVYEPGDLPLAGVTITVKGTDATGQPVERTVVTGPDGRYKIDDLPTPDGNGYTVTETQPVGYDNGGAIPGTLGGTAATPDQIRVSFTPGAHGTGYDFYDRTNRPSSLSGNVWLDTDHDRVRAPSEPQGGGWTVELLGCRNGTAVCADADLDVLNTTVTAADGSYRFEQLVPGEFRVRFRGPGGQLIGGVWPTDPVQNAPGGLHPTLPGSLPAAVIAVSVTGPGLSTIHQDLPYDPGGIVYDSLSAAPVPGAVVTLNGPAGFDPVAHLLNRGSSFTVGADGYYDFFLLPGAPAGEYTVTVTPPSGYMPSYLYPVSAGPLATQTCTVPAGSPAPTQSNPCVMAMGLPVVGVASPYYLSLQAPLGGGFHVTGNHIPLDPSGAALIELRKMTPKLTVKRGELVPYTITARNTRAVAVPNVVLVDTLPPGFRFMEGSATVQQLPGGPLLPVKPVVNGRQLTLPGMNFAANESRRVTMVVGVGVGVGEGEYVNQVIGTQNVGGPVLSNLATAAVRVIPDALFDCTDVIGKVYDDKNANGYQDDGEPGIPNARVVTVNGLLVTSDSEGRYHIACAAIPKEGTGSNLVLKLDERTLPSGYRTTTENPAAERATRGKLIKVNFGATVHRVVRLALQATAFEADAVDVKTSFAPQLDQAVEALAAKPSILRLAYQPALGEAGALTQKRVAAIKAAVLERWKKKGARADKPLFNLDIEVELLAASVKP